MTQRTLPLFALLDSGSRGPVDVLPLISDLLRNIRNIARIGGSTQPVVPPLGGRAMDPAMSNFLAFVRTHYLTNAEQRAALTPREVPRRTRGGRFDVDAWLMSTAILLKANQARLAGAGRSKVAIVDRYLAAPGRWQRREGVNIETLKEWSKPGRYLRAEVWTRDFAAILTSLALPDDLPSWPFAEQKAHLRRLRGPVDTLFAPHTDEWFPFELVAFFYDLSRHTDPELRKTVRKLAPFLATPRSERFLRLVEILLPALADIHDLVGDDPLRIDVRIGC